MSWPVKRRCVFSLFLLLWQSPFGVSAAWGQDRDLPLKVTYIANEGFLVASGEQKVLIDALQRGGIDRYASPPPTTLDELEGARGSFAGVNLILVSHPHRDHFHPASVARHLENNPAAQLISSLQVVEAVRHELASTGAVAARMNGTYPEGSGRSIHTVAETRLEVFRLRHENRRNYGVQNLGLIFVVGGKKILHIGDAEMTAQNFAPHRLPEEDLDLAFLPYWYLTSEKGREIVRTYIRPKQVVAMHIEPADLNEITEEIRAEFPTAIVFSQPLETKTF